MIDTQFGAPSEEPVLNQESTIIEDSEIASPSEEAEIPTGEQPVPEEVADLEAPVVDEEANPEAVIEDELPEEPTLPGEDAPLE